MTHNYYIKVYRLTETEEENYRMMASTEEEPEFESALNTYANRWIMEIRRKCDTEAACRAIMYRYIMDTTVAADAPPEDRIVLAAWAQMMTDRIQETVEALEKNQRSN